MELDSPRALLRSEIEVLSFILTADFPQGARLRAQLKGLQVIGRCDCGCPTIDLETSSGALPATGLESRLLPVEAVVAPAHTEPPGELIVFVDDGRLSGLEYVYYSDAPPVDWPGLGRLTLR